MGPPSVLFELFRAGAMVSMAHIVTPEVKFCVVFHGGSAFAPAQPAKDTPENELP
jgi:hypothetical protein